MPSIAEPCGLSQMIAMRYGTLPIVRETGGLRDSVPPFDAINGTGLGFTFANASAGDMLGAIYRSMQAWYDQPDAFAAMRTRAMEADFSWNRSAQEYLDIYHWITGIPTPGSEPPAPTEEPVPVEVSAPVEEPAPAVVSAPVEEPVPVEEKPTPKKRTAAKKSAAPAEKKEPAKKTAPKTKKEAAEKPAAEKKAKTAKATTSKSKSKAAPKE